MLSEGSDVTEAIDYFGTSKEGLGYLDTHQYLTESQFFTTTVSYKRKKFQFNFLA